MNYKIHFDFVYSGILDVSSRKTYDNESKANINCIIGDIYMIVNSVV
jgi:hypothetical protein